jgi:hypothetical protein
MIEVPRRRIAKTPRRSEATAKAGDLSARSGVKNGVHFIGYLLAVSRVSSSGSR